MENKLYGLTKKRENQKTSSQDVWESEQELEDQLDLARAEWEQKISKDRSARPLTKQQIEAQRKRSRNAFHFVSEKDKNIIRRGGNQRSKDNP